jgi:hypothetical protein
VHIPWTEIHDAKSRLSKFHKVTLNEDDRLHSHSQSSLAVGAGNDGDGASTGDDPLQVLPSAPDTTAVLLDQLLEGDAHLLFDDARVVDVSRDAKDFSARVPLPAETGEPGASSARDSRGHSDGLDVGDGRGTTKETDIGRERGLETGLALLALDRLDERRLLAADVRSGTAVHVDVKVVARSAGVLADETGLVRLVDGLLDVRSLLVELSADVDVGWARDVSSYP